MLKKRQIIKQIEHKLVSTKNIIIIIGARQVGKTSIMRYVLDKYRKDYKNNVLFLDLEDEILLSELQVLKNSEYPAYFKNKGLKIDEKGIVFIDEIQYLDQPTKVLKYLYDEFSHLRLFVSGSSTFEIKKKLKESLTGRKSVFQIDTLIWQEFLEFQRSKQSSVLQGINLQGILEGKVKLQDVIGLEKELEPSWREFVVYGGYPKVTLTKNILDKQDELEEIYNSYIKKDIKDIANIKEIGKYNRLVQLLSWQVGNLAVVEELANAANLNIITCNKYLDLLENTFVVKFIRPFYRNKRVEIVKTPKVYFMDTGLRNAVTRNYQPLDARPDSGSLFENYVYNELAKLYTKDSIKYWRKANSGLEVDFILEDKLGQNLLPIEVKSKNFKKHQIPKSIYSFLENYNASKAVIVNRGLFDIVKVNKTTVYFVPFWLIK